MQRVRDGKSVEGRGKQRLIDRGYARKGGVERGKQHRKKTIPRDFGI